jgi:anti-sigma regulatory factor (Ser/Thr protein kinase)
MEAAKLAVSELVTNVLTHAGRQGDILVILARTGEMLCAEVHDNSPEPPVLRIAAPSDLSGRGMFLVDHLTDESGCYLTPSGKSVWFRIKTDWPNDQAA